MGVLKNFIILCVFIEQLSNSTGQLKLLMHHK